MTPIIGALNIGQSPRSDLTAPLRQLIPHGKIIEVGALDDVNEEQYPFATTSTAYPLTTHLRDGSLVALDSQRLTPLLQSALQRLEDQGVVVASILLCTGSFPVLQGSKPLVKPFQLASAALRSMGLQRIGVVSPIPEQKSPIQQKWTDDGFAASVWTAPHTQSVEQISDWLLARSDENPTIECVVLDYFGYPPEHTKILQQAVELPLIDLGDLAVRALSSLSCSNSTV